MSYVAMACACRELTKEWHGVLITHPNGENGLEMKVAYVAHRIASKERTAVPAFAALMYYGTRSKKLKECPATVLQDCREYWLKHQQGGVTMEKSARQKRQVRKQQQVGGYSRA